MVDSAAAANLGSNDHLVPNSPLFHPLAENHLRRLILTIYYDTKRVSDIQYPRYPIPHKLTNYSQYR
jgi:hypothetical protein